MSDYNRSLKEIVSAKLQKELIVLEDQEGGASCKFGVIYALGNQVSDTQMLSNGLTVFLLYSFICFYCKHYYSKFSFST